MSERPVWFLVLAIVMASANIFAGDGKIVLSAERDLYGFQAQQALVFEKEQLVFSRNSNFLCEPATEVLLGVFRAAYTDEKKKTREYIEQVAARLSQTAAGQDPRAPGHNPHELRLFIGTVEVTGQKPNSATVRRLLTEACGDLDVNLKNWVPEFGVLVKVENGKGGNKLKITELAGAAKGRTSQLTFEQAGCRPQGTGIWDCPIAKYGTASFVVKRR